MNSETILPEVQEVCQKLLRIPPERVFAEAQLVEDLDMDSLFFAELGLALERRFKIEVPEAILPTLKTVGDVAEFVRRKLTGSTP
jgi:acyl carrier protein